MSQNNNVESNRSDTGILLHLCIGLQRCVHPQTCAHTPHTHTSPHSHMCTLIRTKSL